MPRDIEKVRAARRRWYERNKEHAKQSVLSRKNEIRIWLSDLKSNLRCEKCGEEHPGVLDFHHLGDKEIAVAKVIENGWSKERILAEIAKCQVLCSNCHRKLHWEEKQVD